MAVLIDDHLHDYLKFFISLKIWSPEGQRPNDLSPTAGLHACYFTAGRHHAALIMPLLR